MQNEMAKNMPTTSKGCKRQTAQETVLIDHAIKQQGLFVSEWRE